MKLLLHACCGPCLLEPFDALSAAHEVTVAYANPNIHPAREYVKRRDAVREYARQGDIPFVELPYEPTIWARRVAPSADLPEKRCRACFGLRLGLVARHASEAGFEAVATTLTVSPYQDADAIRAAGTQACDACGLSYLDGDFRDRYPDATRRSRDLGMYRQGYCGCLISEVEAGRAREERRRGRAR